jgi:site-specific DNA recombinase
MTKRVAIAARVSTDDQAAEDRSSLELQLEACRSYAQGRGFEVVAEVVEDGVSGAKELADRPGVVRVLELTVEGAIEGVIWYKVDRLSRSARVALDLLHQLESAGIAVYSTREDIDGKTASGQMFRTVLLGVAEFERATIAERLDRGKLGKARKGEWPAGRPPTG